MSISFRIVKVAISISVLMVLAGCKTDFDTFDKTILQGMDSSDIEKSLKKNEISYRYLSCSELKEELSSIKQGCVEPESLGAYVGWVNNGAYMLGMGSADVYFEIEIGKNNKAVGVYTDEIYTFI
ncbi:hypothetical protein NBRC116493_02620 [Aurantivibrio infirmus]